MNLVWHIFKKDLRRLWPNLLLCVAAAFVAYTMSRQLWAFGDGKSSFMPNPQMWFIPCWILWISLFPAIVQSDLPYGTMEFWMTRPIGSHKLFWGKILQIFVFGIATAAAAHALFLLSQGFHPGQAGIGVLRILIPLLIIAPASFGVATLTQNVWSFWSLLIMFLVGAFFVGLFIPDSGIPESADSVSDEIRQARNILALTLTFSGPIFIAALQYRLRSRLFSAVAASILVCAVIMVLHLWRWPLPRLDKSERKIEALKWNAAPVPGKHEVLQGDRRVTSLLIQVDSPRGEAAYFHWSEGVAVWTDGKSIKVEADVQPSAYVGRLGAVQALFGPDYRSVSGDLAADHPIQIILGTPAGETLRPRSYAGQIEGERVTFVKLGTTPLIRGATLVRDGCKLIIDRAPTTEKLNQLKVRYQVPNYKWNGLSAAKTPLLVLVNSSRKEAQMLRTAGDAHFEENGVPGLTISSISWTINVSQPAGREVNDVDDVWMAGAELWVFAEWQGPGVSLPVSLTLPPSE